MPNVPSTFRRSQWSTQKVKIQRHRKLLARPQLPNASKTKAQNNIYSGNLSVLSFKLLRAPHSSPRAKGPWARMRRPRSSISSHARKPVCTYIQHNPLLFKVSDMFFFDLDFYSSRKGVVKERQRMRAHAPTWQVAGHRIFLSRQSKHSSWFVMIIETGWDRASTRLYCLCWLCNYSGGETKPINRTKFVSSAAATIPLSGLTCT